MLSDYCTLDSSSRTYVRIWRYGLEKRLEYPLHPPQALTEMSYMLFLRCFAFVVSFFVTYCTELVLIRAQMFAHLLIIFCGCFVGFASLIDLLEGIWIKWRIIGPCYGKFKIHPYICIILLLIFNRLKKRAGSQFE